MKTQLTSATSSNGAHGIQPTGTTRLRRLFGEFAISNIVSSASRTGMWLAESAVDTESLELLAEHDIRFTVLAPRQAKAFRRVGDEHWHELRDSGVDTRRPYLCKLPSGKSIVLFFYNGDIAQGVAFNGLLNDSQKFAHALLNSFDPHSQETQIVHIATDGETYGPHHKHGDMALAFCSIISISSNTLILPTTQSYFESNGGV